MKYLILYAYYETPNSLKNLQFFVNKGLHENCNVQYVFLLNSKCDVKIPTYTNIKIIHRDNIGYDFGAWSVGLFQMDIDEYDRFIFINDTVLGPFVPRYVPDNIKWYELFTNLLSDKVKLTGTTKNFYRYEHIQSMIFGTDKVGLDILIKNNIFVKNADEIYEAKIKENKMEFIFEYEVGMSKIIIENGYKVDALYLCGSKNIHTYDVCYNGAYFGTTLHPFEIMFVKTNRISSQTIDNYYQWLQD